MNSQQKDEILKIIRDEWLSKEIHCTCKCGKPGIMQADPYTFEVSEKIYVQCLCRDCWVDSCQDV